MIYWIIGLAVLTSFIGFVFWIFRQGKLVARSEELARRVTAGEIIAKQRNEYIKSVDKLVQKEKVDVRGMPAGEFNSLLHDIDKCSKANKTKDT